MTGPGRRMHRRWRVWPLLLASLLACAGHRPSGSMDAPVPSWARRPPAGCAVGFSGPTLDPGDAIRQARRSALESLAAARLGVRVKSELWLQGHRADAYSVQETRGVLRRSHIVALSAGSWGTSMEQHRSAGRDRPSREVFALACPTDLPVPVAATPGQPGWLLDIPSQPHRLCVHGVGGPTRRQSEQDAAALRDGRRALAEAMEMRIRQRSFDDWRGPLRRVSSSEASERARAASAEVDALDSRWADDRGVGPLRTPGIVYGLVCADV